MEITAFDSLIATKDCAPVVELFEDLGFERRHRAEAVATDKDVTRYRMKSAEGFHVDVAQIDVPRDMVLIRMNVRDFDEAYDFLVSKGFKNPRGDERVVTPTNVSSVLTSPTGFSINLVQHFRKEG